MSSPRVQAWRILKNIYTSKNTDKFEQLKYRKANLDSIKNEILNLTGETVPINKKIKKLSKTEIKRNEELAKYGISNDRNNLYYRLKEIDPSIKYINSSKEKLQNYFLDLNRKLSDINDLKEGEYKFKPLAFKSLFRNIKTNPEYSYIVILNDKEYRTLNNSFNNKIDTTQQYGSDLDTSINYDMVDSLVLRVTKKKRDSRKAGAFFPYYNLTGIDLTKYGIYPKNALPELMYENCLYKALFLSGIEEGNLSEIFTDLATKTSIDKIPTTYLKVVAKDLKINLHVTIQSLNDREFTYKHNYGENTDKTYYIGLFEGHYFLNDKTEITKTILIKKLIENGFSIDVKTIFTKDERIHKNFSSFGLIKYILALNKKLDNLLLEPITYKNCIIQNLKKNEEITDLTFNTNQVHKVDEDYNNKKSKANYPLVFTNFKNGKLTRLSYKLAFFDFEAYVDKKTNKYVPYMVSLSYADSERSTDDKLTVKTFSGENCVLQFLQSIDSNVMLIAHNLAYDLQFVIPYLFNAENFIRLGNKVMTCSGDFYNFDTQKSHKLFFKDSYSMISSKLSSFPKMFNLDHMEKEILPYDFYNVETTAKHYSSIKDALAHIPNADDKIEFQNKLHELSLLNPENKHEFAAMEYAKFYCERDVEILKKGYLTFRKWIKDLCDLNIEYIISSASLANTFMFKNDCMLDTYILAGTPRLFIQKCVVGGRVMCRDNEKQHTFHELADFDAVSLYPSAMSRLQGFLKGSPKIITNFEPEKYDGYYIQIKITKVGKHLHFPLLSYVDDNGIRQFTNDLIGKTVFVDNIALEDAVKYQQIEYEFIRGYYFDDGFNTNIVKFIKKVFNERLRLKSEKNPAEQVYKLIMNSCYGKLIQKENKYDEVFIYGEEKFEKKFTYNYDDSFLVSGTKIRDGMYLMTKKAQVGRHFSSPHLGVQVLSMSKRIMNEVMTLAENNDINIYYQDTDSMHIDNDKITKLADLFKLKYDRELIGKNLGQFHSDFDFKSDKDPVAVESIFLGKKSYIDKVKCVNNNVESFEFHIRMKGIPSGCVKQKFYKYKGSKKPSVKETPLDLYKNLYNGDAVTYDLANFCIMKRNKDFSYQKVDSFFREVSF